MGEENNTRDNWEIRHSSFNCGMGEYCEYYIPIEESRLEGYLKEKLEEIMKIKRAYTEYMKSTNTHGWMSMMFSGEAVEKLIDAMSKYEDVFESHIKQLHQDSELQWYRKKKGSEELD